MIVLLSSFSAFASNYECVAGRYETIKISAKMESARVILTFGESNDVQVDRELNGQVVELVKSEERPGRYEGRAIVGQRYRDYRFMEVYFPRSVTIGQTKLTGKFDLSPVTSGNSPLGFGTYELNCSLN